MTTKVANRRSPSGPQVSLQLPFYAVQPVASVTYFAPIGAGTAISAAAFGFPALLEATYEIPLGNALPGANAGNLGVLEITNNPKAATDTQKVTYEIYKNNSPTGFKIDVPNNSTDTFSLDLSNLAVSKGDLISIGVTAPAIADAPVARLFLTWVPQGNI